MSSTSYASGASQSRGVPHNWFFSNDEMRRAKSIQEGFTVEQELQYRQLATRFIQDMVDKLNETFKDGRPKISQLCMCAASIHMHRFFYFHSFNFFDYRDIAAACLFLAGKSEESPRKLEHITKAWWAKKFPKHPSFPTAQHAVDAAALIVQLENVVLHTIAFDLKIELPHPVVLSIMHKSVGHAVNDHGNKKLTECAYFFATDVLCVTSWGIRYSAAAIAVCCVHIVCTWSKHEIPATSDGAPWYAKADPTMTDARLKEMSDEFVEIYKHCKFKLAMYKFKGMVPPAQQSSSSKPVVRDDAPGPLIPPPPLPPKIPRKVDIDEYKERSRSTPSGGDQGSTDRPRKSFMPDTSQVSNRSQGLSAVNLPGAELTSSSGHSRDVHNGRREEERKREKDREYDRRREEKEKRRKEERPEERDRRREEERRKRDHSSSNMSGSSSHRDQHPLHKKPRPEALSHQFVPATLNNNTNGHKPSVRPPQSHLPSVKRPAPALSPPRVPVSSQYDPPAALSPPPPPPPLKLSPPPMPPSNELEDGEVE